jgi:hypothetical protein
MKEATQQQQQQQQTNNNPNTKANRKKELDNVIKNPKSLISIDGLLDGITALVLDCEPMKKNKNIDNFLSRCELIFNRHLKTGTFTYFSK